ncbi:putative quinol monooxygenase [Kordiimonas gwangyangensis]|uniref:putative quinol monooxygenase n=1 Tax=Kordiimonas gwangyangensis TaxID=288022 RepID=UPI0003767A7E|nr:putative quinol monooxygenase [Kordiimonas gwangyangensis]
MSINRRHFVMATGAAVALGGTLSAAPAKATKGGTTMFGLIGKFTAKAGTRDELGSILLEGIGGMPGCLSYVVATDPADENALWITEVWDSRESHEGSLKLPSVQDAIKRGRPLIEGMEMVATTSPIGGHGLA